jgi:fructosamine-3-kinase
MSGIAGRVSRALGVRVTSSSRLGGGAAGSVSRLVLADGSSVVAKHSESAAGDGLLIEARSLKVVAERSRLLVPRVLHAERDLMVVEYIEGTSSFDDGAERHAAELLAALHAVRSVDGRYGLEFDALIGPLHQPNTPSASWVEFWRERRLLHMAHEAARAGRLRFDLVSRVEALGRRLGELIPDRPPPSLIHGDVWSGNVLAAGGRVTGFIDPAPYFAHHEVELAFITMFSTFGGPFFERYAEVGTPIDDASWRARRHVYVLYPLLVHVRLFGGGYVGQLDHALDMLGC